MGMHGHLQRGLAWVCKVQWSLWSWWGSNGKLQPGSMVEAQEHFCSLPLLLQPSFSPAQLQSLPACSPCSCPSVRCISTPIGNENFQFSTQSLRVGSLNFKFLSLCQNEVVSHCFNLRSASTPFFIVVQVQLSPFSPHYSPLLPPSPPATLNPTLLWLCPCVLYTCSW